MTTDQVRDSTKPDGRLEFNHPPNRTRLLAIVIGAALIAIALGWGAVQESFWWDDYQVLKSVRLRDGHLFDMVVASGRPVSAALQTLGFLIAPSPESAWILRLLGLAGVLTSFLLLAKRWLRADRGGLLIVAAAIMFCLPPFQIYAYWAVAWEFSWSMVLSIVALLAWERQTRWGRVVAITLLTIALLNYPPTSVFLFAVIAVEAAAFAQSSKAVLRRTFSAVVLTVIAGVASVVVAALATVVLGTGATDRVALLSPAGVPEKLWWLVREPISVGLRPFLVDMPVTPETYLTVIPAAAVIIVALVIQSHRIGEFAILRFVAIALPMVMTFAPILVIPENYLEFRFIPGYAWGIATIIGFTLLVGLQNLLASGTVFSWQRVSVVGRVTIAVGATLTFVGIVALTNQRFDALIGQPYNAKTQFFERTLAKCEADGRNAKIVIVNAIDFYPPLRTWATPIGPGYGVGGFSILTDADQEWVPVPNIWLLDQRDVPITRVEHDSPEHLAAKADPTACVIDLQRLRTQLLGKR